MLVTYVIGLHTAGFVVNALAPGIDISKGYHESTHINVNIDGIEKTLQEAITAGDLGGANTTCATSGTCSQVCIGTDCKTRWPNLQCEMIFDDHAMSCDWNCKRYDRVCINAKTTDGLITPCSNSNGYSCLCCKTV